jgi:hypothetical protein
MRKLLGVRHAMHARPDLARQLGVPIWRSSCVSEHREV